ncbi:MAG: lysophospholipid acyltransferase family protein [Verrucomicrobia bacterium]|nr:lysophospholipid acyltransferase family protein [Verrucomicrobiota bacterium]
MKASALYRSELWKAGLSAARKLPAPISGGLARLFGAGYYAFSNNRPEIVIENLLPAVNGDYVRAEKLTRELFQNFAQKLVDLWRYESGIPIEHLFRYRSGLEVFETAKQEKRGILIVTPHLGNWEFGAPILAKRGIRLLVITMEEPDPRLTEMRKASRERWGIETLVIGSNPFAFIEVIRRLEAGEVVALLVDRPHPANSVIVELFGKPFAASVAPAELARATGCKIVPVYLPRIADGYAAHTLPEIEYERAALRPMEARQALAQKIMRAFEPVIREHLSQWYHFVPIWNREESPLKQAK